MKMGSQLARVLDQLEKFYGPQKPSGPMTPYEMVLHRNCGYPQSDARCDKGFASLRKEIGLRPDDILSASNAKLLEVMRPSVMNPALSARRLKEIAARVKEEFGGDLRAAMKLPLPEARKALKKFPTIGDSTADKILLFTKTAPVAAIPSIAVHVPIRLGFGQESKNWGASYRSVQEIVAAELGVDGATDAASSSFRANAIKKLLRAYVFLKHHAQQLCKLSRPLCDDCPLSSSCLYYKSPRRFSPPAR